MSITDRKAPCMPRFTWGFGRGTCTEGGVLAHDALALDLVDQLARRVEDAPVPRAQLQLVQRVRRARLPLLGLGQQVEPDAALIS